MSIHARVSPALTMAVASLLAALAACGSNPCPTDTTIMWCRTPDPTTNRVETKACCVPNGLGTAGTVPVDSNCCPFGQLSFSLSEIPRPDLTYANLDGLVDFGTSRLKIETADGGDGIETRLQGRVAILGGVCSAFPCDMEVVLVELTPVQSPLTSNEGKSVSGLVARNANVWKGQRSADGTITMSSASRLALEATVEEEKTGRVLDPTTWFKGKLYYNVNRKTDAGTRVNNLIEISGTFADEKTKAWLTISIWATSCEPEVHATAACLPDIEQGSRPGHVQFSSTFERLGNMQSSQDLCDALAAADAKKVCTAAGDAEFPSFTCGKQPLPPASTPAEVAKQLTFRWTDAGGHVFSDRYRVNLDRLPVFPVTLTVANMWGREVSETLADAPRCTPDVPLAPGACAWEAVGPRSHQRGPAWCPQGAFLTALDLDGGSGFSAHDLPLVGHARCCAPGLAAEPRWGACSWVPVGRKSHQSGAPWCANGSFLAALDLDADGGLSAHDSPIVGQALCCAPADALPASAGGCSWVEVGRRSHQQGGNWCGPESYLTAIDLDADGGLAPTDSPIVGRALCCASR